MYYPCRENKGADQLRGYREADLRLCFRIGKNPVFSRCGSFYISTVFQGHSLIQDLMSVLLFCIPGKVYANKSGRIQRA